MSYHWQVLQIAPTGDTRAIKRAYATQLKRLRPEEDPQAFQQLREAYEWALDAAHWVEHASEIDDADLQSPQCPAENETPATNPHTPVFQPPQSTENASDTPSPPQFLHPESAQAAIEAFVANLESEDCLARLDALLSDRRWHFPEASQWLETALLQEAEQQFEIASAGGLSDWAYTQNLWLPVLAHAARHFGWLDFLQPRLAPFAACISWLRRRLAYQAVEALCKHAPTLTPDQFAAELKTQLQSEHFLHLQNREALKLAWAESLTEATLPPGDTAKVFEAFDWFEHPDDLARLPGGEALLARMKAELDSTLLTRIANGEFDHPRIARGTATRLLQPSIGWRDRRDAMRPRNSGMPHIQDTMQDALLFLQHEAPAAYAQIPGQVRQWWAAPHPIENSAWNFLAFLGWFTAIMLSLQVSETLGFTGSFWVLLPAAPAFVIGPMAGYGLAWSIARGLIALRQQISRLRHWMDRHNIEIVSRFWVTGWLITGFTIVIAGFAEIDSRGWAGEWKFLALFLGIALGYVLGALVGCGMTWLQRHWLRIYLPWQQFDHGWTARAPIIGRWMNTRDYGLTRDILPFIACWIGLYVELSEDDKALSLLPTFILAGVLWLVWSRMLRWLSRP